MGYIKLIRFEDVNEGLQQLTIAYLCFSPLRIGHDMIVIVTERPLAISEMLAYQLRGTFRTGFPTASSLHLSVLRPGMLLALFQHSSF
jgi:hypothetical protein